MKTLKTIIKFLGKFFNRKAKPQAPKVLFCHDIKFIWINETSLVAADMAHWEVAMLAHSFIRIYPPTDNCSLWKTIEGDNQPISYFEGTEKEAFATAAEWAKTNYSPILRRN